ncbi:MAG: hypothetical protein WBC91_18720 [Phototrophicaceae bacterium]
MTDILERVLGGGGAVGGIFGEAREALIGGCWGVFMSAGFFFVFFATGLAMLFGVVDLPFALENRAIMFPFVCVLGISALLSPFVGSLFGAQSGAYSVVRHLGCFVLYIILLVGGMIAATILL